MNRRSCHRQLAAPTAPSPTVGDDRRHRFRSDQQFRPEPKPQHSHTGAVVHFRSVDRRGSDSLVRRPAWPSPTRLGARHGSAVRSALLISCTSADAALRRSQPDPRLAIAGRSAPYGSSAQYCSDAIAGVITPSRAQSLRPRASPMANIRDPSTRCAITGLVLRLTAAAARPATPYSR